MASSTSGGDLEASRGRALGERLDQLSLRTAAPGAVCGALLFAALSQPIRSQGAGSSVSVKDFSGWLRQAEFENSGLLVAVLVAVIFVAMIAIGSGLTGNRTRRVLLSIAGVSSLLIAAVALKIGSGTISLFSVLAVLAAASAGIGIWLSTGPAHGSRRGSTPGRVRREGRRRGA